MPKYKVTRCTACGAEARIVKRGEKAKDIEYRAECCANPERHGMGWYKTAQEAAIRWNARQKALTAYRR